MFMVKLSESLNFLIHHMWVQMKVVTGENFNRNLLLIKFIKCQVYTAETTLSQFILKFQKLHSY